MEKEINAPVRQVFDYYLAETEQLPSLYTLTDQRKKMGAARFSDALKRTSGDMEKAIELMKFAVDAMAASKWHMGTDPKHNTKCNGWEVMFLTTDKFENWLAKA